MTKAALLLTLALLAPMAMAGGVREETSFYVGVTNGLDFQSAETGSVLCATHVGGTCFSVAPGERVLALEVVDVSGRSTLMGVQWRGANGFPLGGGFQFCGSVSDIVVPTHAIVLVVYPVSLVGVSSSVCGEHHLVYPPSAAGLVTLRSTVG